MKQFCLFVVLLGLSATALGGVYTWKDKNGQVHYSDQPPPDVDVKTVNAAPTNGVGDKGTSFADKERAYKERQAKKAESDKKTADEQSKREAKETYCKELQDRLATLNSGARIANTNAKGERAFMSDDARAAETTRTRSELAKECNAAQ